MIIRDGTLKRSRRRELISSVRRLAVILAPDRPLCDIPADPEWCRGKLDRIAPAALGIADKTWSNLRSNFAAALTAGGIRPDPAPGVDR